MNIADHIVYFKKHIPENQRNSIEAALRSIDGVIAPHFIPNKEKLLVIAYNPEKAQTQQFRDTFINMGVEAVFVGM